MSFLFDKLFQKQNPELAGEMAKRGLIFDRIKHRWVKNPVNRAQPKTAPKQTSIGDKILTLVDTNPVLREFSDYVHNFYGPGGLYADAMPGGKGVSKDKIRLAIKTYLEGLENDNNWDSWGGGDSVDRERIRTIIDPGYDPIRGKTAPPSQKLEHARNLGIKAREEGRSGAPAQDKSIMEILSSLSPEEWEKGEGVALMRAFNDGWDSENIKISDVEIKETNPELWAGLMLNRKNTSMRERIDSYVDMITDMLNEDSNPRYNRNDTAKIAIVGERFAKIIKVDENGNNQGVHSYIDIKTGDIIKGDGKGPTRTKKGLAIRGNILSDDLGRSKVSVHGPKSLKNSRYTY